MIIDPSEQKASIAPEPTARLATTLNEQINPTGTGSSIDPYQFTCFSMSTPTYDAGDNFTWTCNCNKTRTQNKIARTQYSSFAGTMHSNSKQNSSAHQRNSIQQNSKDSVLIVCWDYAFKLKFTVFNSRTRQFKK